MILGKRLKLAKAVDNLIKDKYPMLTDTLGVITALYMLGYLKDPKQFIFPQLSTGNNKQATEATCETY